MEKDPSIEKAAERIVAWAAQNPLSAAEAEQRYAHLLAGLQPIPARTPAWAMARLGRLAVRYWNERVDELRQAVDAISLTPAAALRGGAPASVGAEERILRAEGASGAACVKITENADHATVALALWIEPKAPDEAVPFAVTVLGGGDAVVAGPVECAAKSVVRFASVEPAGEHAIVFRAKGETWRVRWELVTAEG